MEEGTGGRGVGEEGREGRRRHQGSKCVSIPLGFAVCEHGLADANRRHLQPAYHLLSTTSRKMQLVCLLLCTLLPASIHHQQLPAPSLPSSCSSNTPPFPHLLLNHHPNSFHHPSLTPPPQPLALTWSSKCTPAAPALISAFMSS